MVCLATGIIVILAHFHILWYLSHIYRPHLIFFIIFLTNHVGVKVARRNITKIGNFRTECILYLFCSFNGSSRSKKTLYTNLATGEHSKPNVLRLRLETLDHPTNSYIQFVCEKRRETAVCTDTSVCTGERAIRLLSIVPINICWSALL